MPASDPRKFATSPGARTADRLAKIEARLAALERLPLQVPEGDGPPTSTPPDGVFYIDRTDGRLYFRYSAAWHYVTQTA